MCGQESSLGICELMRYIDLLSTPLKHKGQQELYEDGYSRKTRIDLTDLSVVGE